MELRSPSDCFADGLPREVLLFYNQLEATQGGNVDRAPRDCAEELVYRWITVAVLFAETEVSPELRARDFKEDPVDGEQRRPKRTKFAASAQVLGIPNIVEASGEEQVLERAGADVAERKNERTRHRPGNALGFGCVKPYFTMRRSNSTGSLVRSTFSSSCIEMGVSEAIFVFEVDRWTCLQLFAIPLDTTTGNSTLEHYND
jgi:hypothetical protein